MTLNSPKLEYYKDGQKHIHLLGQPSLYEQFEHVRVDEGEANVRLKENVKYYNIDIDGKTNIHIIPAETRNSFIQHAKLILNMKEISTIIFDENVELSISSLLNSKKEYILDVLVLGDKLLGYIENAETL